MSDVKTDAKTDAKTDVATLEIRGLEVSVEGKEILKGIDLVARLIGEAFSRNRPTG